MKQRATLFLTSILIILVSSTTHAAPINVAAGKTVSLHDGAFFTGGWSGGAIVSPDTIVDEIFLPSGNQWDQGAVWWDDTDGIANHITIDLDGTFRIESFIAQVDDNDAYLLEYWNGSSWLTAWDIPNYDQLGWGLLTRPDVNDNSVAYLLPTEIITSALRVSGNLSNGDNLFAVSEIQAYGYNAPEPSMLLLLGSALLGFGLKGKQIRRRKS